MSNEVRREADHHECGRVKVQQFVILLVKAINKIPVHEKQTHAVSPETN